MNIIEKSLKNFKKQTKNYEDRLLYDCGTTRNNARTTDCFLRLSSGASHTLASKHEHHPSFMVRKPGALCAVEQKLQQHTEWQQRSRRRHKVKLCTVKCSSLHSETLTKHSLKLFV